MTADHLCAWIRPRTKEVSPTIPLTTQATEGVPLWRSRVFLTIIVALIVGITLAFTTLDLQFAATNSLTLATRHPAAPSSTPSQMTTTCSPATEVNA
ncbi:hypothetical protein, partial [Deinococcus sp.]|uniref:hypothetical protein n=1 Tax=Deinococcus sp. TaxID=47478 RepID=UPI002869D410